MFYGTKFLTDNLTSLEKIIETSAELLNPYVKSWKGEGKKVVGYTCTYTPEEIIHAAGILPYRIRGTGSTGTTLADVWYGPTNCSYPRCCFELVLEGRYDFLDGAVLGYSCDHMRRMYDNWKAQEKTPSFIHYLGIPHSTTEYGLEYYMEEVVNLKEHLEKHFEIEITDGRLKDAIKLYDETRNLLRKLYELRWKDTPRITGAETLAIILAGTAMSKGEYNLLLKELIKEVESREGISEGYRLMIVGSVNDDPSLVKLIEDLGAIVVADSLCFGARYFWDSVEEEGDPLRAIVTRYYNHISCPRMFGEYPRRLEFVKDMVKKGNVDGVILEHMKFCDMHGAENMLYARDLEKEGIPALRLERHYGPLADIGRIRTRVEAFLERIKG